MAFLTQDELKTVATAEVVNLITRGDEAIVTQIIVESIDLVKTYLFMHFDTNAIFTAVDDARSQVILKYLKDIVIHEIYIRRTKQVNEAAKLRYDEAMLWLEKVAKGIIQPDLPLKIVDGEGVPFMKLGSRKTYKNHW